MIGTPYANRDQAEVHNLVGCFVKCVQYLKSYSQFANLYLRKSACDQPPVLSISAFMKMSCDYMLSCMADQHTQHGGAAAGRQRR